ncbi:MAG: YkgJ family cysteine cluster protein [Halothiobacillaceae bacterium]|nr:YkgJ family cysteine cluster protein [Halothiobacillaceae bacterium]
MSNLSCRPGCAACCIEPSITSPLPGMPEGKPAGVPCLHLTATGLCALFGQAERPAFCTGLRASDEMCGQNAHEARTYLYRLEALTRPEAKSRK